MPQFTAFLDANVLYPAELRSFLMFLAVSGIFRARWSDDVHEEWISNLLKSRPDLTRAQLERTRQLMDKHAPDALVTGYRQLIPALNLPDPNDRHVLAAAFGAALALSSPTIRRTFPPRRWRSSRAKGRLQTNSFSTSLAYIRTKCSKLRRRIERVFAIQKTREEYLSTLERQGLIESVTALRAIWTEP